MQVFPREGLVCLYLRACEPVRQPGPGQSVGQTGQRVWACQACLSRVEVEGKKELKFNTSHSKIARPIPSACRPTCLVADLRAIVAQRVRLRLWRVMQVMTTLFRSRNLYIYI